MAEGNSSDYEVREALEAAEYIAEKAKEIYIDDYYVQNVAHQVMTFFDNKKGDNLHHIFAIDHPEGYPLISDFKMWINWLFVLHTLNFSLFNSKDTKQWTVNNKDGYFGLCLAVNRAVDEGKPLWDPKYYKSLTQDDLEHIFRSDDGGTTIPLINERLEVLHKVGNVLFNKYQGTFEECIKSSDYDASKLVKLLFDEFESYRDEAIYEGIKVRLHTKAFALVTDICTFHKIKVFHINTKNMMSMMFTDYRTSIILLYLRVLRYSDMLVNRFKNSNEPLEYGSREELEIRGCSFVAADKILTSVEIIFRLNMRCSQHTAEYVAPILTDRFLFEFLKDKIDTCVKEQPFHYIRSVHY